MNYLNTDNKIISESNEKELNSVSTFWYAIYTNPRAEKKVLDRMLDSGIEAFLPMETVIRQWSDRKKKVDVPMIKSYVFVKVERKEIFSKVLKVFGAVRVLRYLGKPAVIKDYEIENLRIISKNGANLVDVSSEINIEIGEVVEIEKGPFHGLKGKCARINGKKGVVFEMEMFGSVHTVEIAKNYLKC